MKVIENIIKSRNPQFQFDKDVTAGLVFELLRQNAWSFFRGLKWRTKGKWLLLGKGVSFFNRKNIRIGNWVKIGDYSYLSGLGKGAIEIGNNVSIGAFSRIVISTSFNNVGSHIHIGNNVGIGEYAYLGGAGGLEIGDDCIIGQYLSCHPENHVFQNEDALIRHQGVTRQGIVIGKNCWIGARVTVCDGVTIGDHCVVAAGAVITSDMPDNSVIGGVPAKVIKSRLNNQSIA